MDKPLERTVINNSLHLTRNGKIEAVYSKTYIKNRLRGCTYADVSRLAKENNIPKSHLVQIKRFMKEDEEWKPPQ